MQLKISKNNLAVIFEELFQISLGGYLLLIIIESFKTGFVSSFFDLNILLFAVIVLGAGRIFVNRPEKVLNQEIKNKDWYIITLLSIVCGVFVYFKTRDMGLVSIVASIFTVFIVFIVSYLQFGDKKD